MAMGLQDLVMFRDNLQQPEMTGMDNLRNLQALTMQSMAAEDYMNQPQPMMMDTGLMSLPVAQAGFGGFIKSITKPFKSIGKGLSKAVKGVAKGVRNVAKSDIGRIAIPLLLSYYAGPLARGLGFANPGLGAKALVVGGGTGLGSLVAGDDPEEAFKRGAQAGGTYYVGGKLFGGGAKPDKALTPDKTGFAGSAPTTGSYSQVGQAQLAQGGLQPQFAVGAEGTGAISGLATAPSIGSVGADSAEALLQPERFTNYKDFGMQTNVQPEFSVGDVAADQAALDASMSPLTKIQDALASGVQKVRDLPKLQQAALGVGALSLLGGPQPVQQQFTPDQLASAGITTDFDGQRVVYRNADGEEIDYQTALQMIQQASQSFGPGGQRRASGVRLGFERVNPDSNFQGASPEQLANVVKNVKLFNEGGMVDPVLSASGGVIGMMYGGMPANNMDVKYKEFSGMVGGRGSGMEDNVYMPIVEGEQGQQVATLAVSPKEYVVDANTMSLLGNGNPDEGAEIMDETVKDIRMAATGQKKQQKEIDGLAALDRMRRSV